MHNVCHVMLCYLLSVQCRVTSDVQESGYLAADELVHVLVRDVVMTETVKLHPDQCNAYYHNTIYAHSIMLLIVWPSFNKE